MMDTILQYTIEIRLFFFIGLFVLFAAWEILLPDHISSYSRKSRWTWNLILVVLNNFFIRILSYLYQHLEWQNTLLEIELDF